MKVLLALVFVVLVASAEAQQPITLDNCLYGLGLDTADAAFIYKDRNNKQNIQKMRGDIQMTYTQCMAALSNTLGTPFDCDTLLMGVERVSTADLPRVHLSYAECVSQL